MASDRNPVSLKPGIVWPGITTLSQQVGDDRRMKSLINGYITEDGTNISRFPGWRLAYDPNYAAASASTLTKFHGFKFARGGTLIVVAEDDFTTAGVGATRDSLVGCIIHERGNITNPSTKVDFAFEVANRYAKSATASVPGDAARGQRSLPYKSGLDLTNDRVIVNVPGYNCCFQIPFKNRLEADNLPTVVFRPRCLGVPKGIIMQPDTVGRTDGGASNPLALGDYVIRVAWKDEGTGEVGIASEPHTVTLTGTENTIDLRVVMQGELMPETFAFTLQLFAARVNENAEVMGLVREFNATTGSVGSGRGSHNVLSVTWIPGKIDFDTPPPVIEQMPRGAKSVKTIRGFTFFGGTQGDYGTDGHYILGTLRTDDALEAVFTDRALGYINQQGFGIGGENIPPAYAGIEYMTSALFNSPRKSGRWDRYVNKLTLDDFAATTPFELLHSKVVSYPPQGGAGPDRIMLVPERAAIQYSAQGVPGVVPAINRIFVDSDQNDDIEALGKVGNTLIICTKNQTYGLAFNQNPKGRAPIAISSRHGCISPNAMIEFDGGLVWISERGPVATMGGNVEWVGLDVKNFFTGPDKIYKFDSRGMMYNAVGVHDPDRALVIFALRRDAHTTDHGDLKLSIDQRSSAGANRTTFRTTAAHGLRQDDIVFLEDFVQGGDEAMMNGFYRVFSVPSSTEFEVYTFMTVGTVATTGTCYKNGQMSKVGNDELLVWSYKNNAWSTVALPAGFEVVWMDRIQMQDGEWRVAMMNPVGEIYVLDDASVDSMEFEISQSEDRAAGTGNTAEVASAVGMREGMHYYITQGNVLTSSGTVTNISGTTLTLSKSWEKVAGVVYFIHVGEIPLTIETHEMKVMPSLRSPMQIKEIIYRSRTSSSNQTINKPITEVALSTESQNADMESELLEDKWSNQTKGGVRGLNLGTKIVIHGASKISLSDIQVMVRDA